MVKGVSRQVIVVQSPDPKLFEQAIFILRDDVQGVTDDMLLKEAQKALRRSSERRHRGLYGFGPAWACGGAALTAFVWLLSVYL